MNRARKNKIRKVISSLEDIVAELSVVLSEEERSLLNTLEQFRTNKAYSDGENYITSIEYVMNDIESVRLILKSLVE